MCGDRTWHSPNRTGQSLWNDESGVRNFYKTVEMNCGLNSRGRTWYSWCLWLSGFWSEIQAESMHSEPKREAVWDGVRKPVVFLVSYKSCSPWEFLKSFWLEGNSWASISEQEDLRRPFTMSGEKERTAAEDRCTQCLFGELTEINYQDQTASVHLGRFNTWDCDSETWV